MLAVKQTAGRLERFIHLIERTVFVRAASELLRKAHFRPQRGRGLRTARSPEALELGLQDENPAGRHVRQGLGLRSFGLRTSELELQIASLRRGTSETVAHGTDTRGIRVRSTIQSVQAAREFGDLGLSLAQEVEENSCDLQ
ncbi:hypothetical protein OHA98_41255 [Streptomyces sp. NBC_00654]|uniref:hypothetical protein n=1 Tax=Streptomyces sp. NBC_00654 TaxID=2975799 RepID=UPI00224D89CF|nr:hypothetical protein [Streptomyces sp. NBC_00654]MCX4971043.1 hypothetical protein [Streptomyces sp. NBC_00654]